jgi:hypothetical protein
MQGQTQIKKIRQYVYFEKTKQMEYYSKVCKIWTMFAFIKQTKQFNAFIRFKDRFPFVFVQLTVFIDQLTT